MLPPRISSPHVLQGLLWKDAGMLNAFASFWWGERLSQRHFMDEFPVPFHGPSLPDSHPNVWDGHPKKF